MVKIQRYPEGTRVVVSQGRLPIDPAILGQAGTIIRHDRHSPTRYAVELDSERDLRIFEEDELVEETDTPAETEIGDPSG